MKGALTSFLKIEFKLLFFFSISLWPFSINAQTSCPQNITLARNLFSQGRYFEIEPVLAECLIDGFTKQEKIEALELLSLSYIYLDDASKADSTYLMLLKMDPEHIVNPATDLPDLVFLHQSFKTTPIFKWNISIGINQNFHRTIYHYSVFPNFINSPGNNTFKSIPVTSYNLGAGLEFDIHKKISVVLETQFMASEVDDTYNIRSMNTSGSNPKHYNWLNIPLYFKYEFGKTRLKPYVTLGGVLNILLSANYKVLSRDNSEAASTTLAKISFMNLSDPLNYSLMLGGGVMFKTFERSFMVLDLSYGMGMTNITEEKRRYSIDTKKDQPEENLITFNLIADAFRVDQLIFSVKFLQPLYKPRKIIPR